MAKGRGRGGDACDEATCCLVVMIYCCWVNSDFRYIFCTIQGLLKLAIIIMSSISLSAVVWVAEGSFTASAGRPQLFALVSLVCLVLTIVSFLTFCCKRRQLHRLPWFFLDFAYLSIICLLYITVSYIYFWQNFPNPESASIVPTMILYIITTMMAYRDFRFDYHVNPPKSYAGYDEEMDLAETK